MRLLFANWTPQLTLSLLRCLRAALKLPARLGNPYSLPTDDPADWFSCSRLLALMPSQADLLKSWKRSVPCSPRLRAHPQTFVLCAFPHTVPLPQRGPPHPAFSVYPSPSQPSPEARLVATSVSSVLRVSQLTFVPRVIWGLRQWGMSWAYRSFPKCRPQPLLHSPSIHCASAANSRHPSAFERGRCLRRALAWTAIGRW